MIRPFLTFEEWHLKKYGIGFDAAYRAPGETFDRYFRALGREVQNYHTDLAREIWEARDAKA